MRLRIPQSAGPYRLPHPGLHAIPSPIPPNKPQPPPHAILASSPRRASAWSSPASESSLRGGRPRNGFPRSARLPRAGRTDRPVLRWSRSRSHPARHCKNPNKYDFYTVFSKSLSRQLKEYDKIFQKKEKR